MGHSKYSGGISKHFRGVAGASSLIAGMRRAGRAGSNARRGRSRSRSSVRGGRSRTRTASKRRTGRVKVEGTGGQISGFKRSGRVKRFTKKFYSRLSPQYVFSSKAFEYKAAAGLQNVFEYYCLDNVVGSTLDNDLNKIMNQAQNYQQTVTVGGSTYQVKGLAPNTQKVYIEQCTAKLMLTNQENANCEVHIYDVAVRKDGQQPMTTTWNNGLTDEQFSGNNTVVGVSPFSSEQFTQYYKVLRKTRIVLGEGQSHTHFINWKPRRVFNAEELSQADSYIRGITYGVLVVAAGMPVALQAGLGQATTAPTALASVFTKQIKYKVAQESQTVYTLWNSGLLTAGTQVMDIATGGVTPNFNA